MACHRTLLEHDQAAAHFVDRRQLLMPHFVRLPDRCDLAAQRIGELVALGHRQIGTIAFAQTRRQTVVFVNQRPA
jgi:hypothetical protein